MSVLTRPKGCASVCPSAGNFFLPAHHALLLLFLALDAGWAAPVVLSSRLLTLPANAGAPLFVDVVGDGRCALLVLEPVERKLLNYRQRPDGFTNSPDQVIALPPQTAWVAVCDVDAHPGLELLMSTATGLVYSRQNAGLFEAERHTLIEARQVFTNYDLPILTLLTTNKANAKDSIPVVSAGQAVLYHGNSAYEWTPGPPLSLDAKQTTWHVSRNQRRDPWTLGGNPNHVLRVHQSFRAKPDLQPDQEPENETIRKIIEDMKKAPASSPPSLDRMDLNGDGREDLVLWQCSGKLDFKTDLYVFLRGPDQKLPERPSQTLHCHGFPIPLGSTQIWSPMSDLNGDGVRELVLLEFKTSFTSTSSLVKTALSHGLDWALAVRTFHDGAFSHSPDASVPLTMVLPAEVLFGWPLCIQGDFNGDGRPDLLVRRSDTHWNIICSTTDGRWFTPEPAITFDTPANGYIEIKDLNGDGLADIIWHELDSPNLTIFMSPSRQPKGKKP